MVAYYLLMVLEVRGRHFFIGHSLEQYDLKIRLLLPWLRLYKTIMSTIESLNGGVFFIDGPGGTRKTFLYRALLGTVRSQDKITIAMATSSVTASIMPGG
jgi:hypothetical protein